MQVKEKDVFSFRYKEEVKEAFYLDPYHAFDGQLIAKKDKEGELYLEDTYSGWPVGEFPARGKRFSIDQAVEEGELKFVCNLNKVKEIHEHQKRYFKEEDVFDLSYQHGCYKKWVVRIGAKRDKDHMLKFLRHSIGKYEREIEWNKREISRLKDKVRQVEMGNLEVYI